MFKIKLDNIEITTDSIEEAGQLIKSLKVKEPREPKMVTKVARPRKHYGRKVSWTKDELSAMWHSRNEQSSRIVKDIRFARHSKSGVRNMLWVIRHPEVWQKRGINKENVEYLKSFLPKMSELVFNPRRRINVESIV